MHKTHIESGTLLRNGTWRRGVAAAVALAIAGAGVSPLVHAQSTTVGNVYGHIAANSGDTVSVKNVSTGVERSVSVGENGRFLTSSLPPGHYVVTLTKAGATVSSVELDVLAGRGSEAVFEAELEEVVVSATALAIDVSTTNNGTVFTASQLTEVPIANHDLNGIMNLAANTVSADSRYSGGISIGGGGPSENAYYINGFAVTNPLDQLGSMELPYGAIQQVQVQTGGFGAEFGRSVGGVVNIVTKSGGQEWHGGASVAYEPDGLRASDHNIYYHDTGAFSDTDGTLYRYKKDNSTDAVTYSANIGGPIIPEKLFIFAAGDFKETKDKSVDVARGASTAATTGWKDSFEKNPRYLAKVDWYITENNHLEATLFGDNYKNADRYYGYNYTTFNPTTYSYTEKSKNYANVTPGVGGDAQIFKYTGNLLDNLTLTAAYGMSKFKHTDTYNPTDLATSPQVTFSTVTSSAFIDPRILSLGAQASLVPANKLPAGTFGIAPGANETTKSFRLDLEWALGDHLLRGGVDINRLKSAGAGDIILSPQTSDTIIPPGVSGTYFSYLSSAAAGRGDSLAIYGGQTQTLNQAGATSNGGRYYYVRARERGDITDAESNQAAQYLEDRWQVVDNVLVTLGLRNESFYNKNGNGEKFLKMDSFLSPRFATSWDVNGDASLKIYGSAGRYSLQVPTHIAVRGASSSVLLDRYYAYTGVNTTTGAPTGLTPLGDWFSANNEYGQEKDPRSVSGQNMKPTYQDEITLGTEAKVMPDYTAGAALTYRKLKASMDDFCDYRVIDAYAAAHNIDLSGADFYPFSCATINVGADNTLYFDPDGANDDGGVDQPPVRFDLTAADIGLPKPKRTYLALDLFLEHPFKDSWYGKLTYTWSKNKGNTEGQTKSDTGQTDVAVTSTWDFHELMEYSYGYLPNDRRHQIKAYGYYQLTSEFGFGSTLIAESGRPKNCLGLYGGTGEDIYAPYGQFFYCNGLPSPRGSAGRLPWNYSLDLSAVYKPSFVQGLSARMDVFNVTNHQTVLSIDEQQYTDSGVLSPTFNRPISYSEPRSFRFTIEYAF